MRHEQIIRTKHDCIARLESAGISFDDAKALRLISMALHRWHEMECGDSNNYESWCITRGHRQADGTFVYDDNGKPFREVHPHNGKTYYHAIADHETKAKQRLTKILERYPTLSAYIQGNPRGAALYIIRPGDVPAGSQIDSCYSNGIAVYK